IGPVAAGMTIGLALILARPVLQRGRYAILDVAVIVAAFAVLLAGAAPTIGVIGASAAFGAVFLGRERPTSTDAPMS
ncbi:MAG: hypothetical protein ABR525_09235, partial [Candidatus Limnocylindria bacterium]